MLYFGLHFVKPKLIVDLLEELDSDFCMNFYLFCQNIRIYPPSNVLVSRGKARTLLAKLRALQEATGM